MEDAENEVMTLKEVAKYLQLEEKSVLAMVEARQMPAAQLDGKWRFMKLLIDDWLAFRTRVPAPKKRRRSVAGQAVPDDEEEGLHTLFSSDVMNLSVRPGSKREVLTQLVEPLQRSGCLPEPGPFVNSLVNRERLASTAMGNGAAVPHPRTPVKGLFSESVIVLGLCPEGTDFDAPDEKPVHVCFLICATDEKVHLRLMAQISGLLGKSGILNRLRKCQDGADVVETIREAEAGV